MGGSEAKQPQWKDVALFPVNCPSFSFAHLAGVGYILVLPVHVSAWKAAPPLPFAITQT